MSVMMVVVVVVVVVAEGFVVMAGIDGRQRWGGVVMASMNNSG